MRLERVTLTQDQIDRPYAEHMGAFAPGSYISYTDGRGETRYTTEETLLTCPACGHEQIKNNCAVIHTCALCGTAYDEAWNRPQSRGYQERVAPADRVHPRPVSAVVEPVFAIGGLNRGDGAELPMPAPKLGRVCPLCRQAESDGAMFTTIGTVCDDCA